MRLTEEEAAEKWCPHNRQPTNIGGEGGGNHDGSCIASGCMQWRWFDPEFERFSYPDVPGTGWELESISPTQVDGVSGQPMRRWRRPRAADRTGYCGLAGIPTGAS